MDEKLKKAILEWHKEDEENRCLILIASKKVGCSEETGEVDADMAMGVLGNHGDLVEAVRASLKDKSPFHDIVKEATMKNILDKLLTK